MTDEIEKEFEEAVNLTEKEIAFIKRHKGLHEAMMEEYERIKRNRFNAETDIRINAELEKDQNENQTGDKE